MRHTCMHTHANKVISKIDVLAQQSLLSLDASERAVEIIALFKVVVFAL